MSISHQTIAIGPFPPATFAVGAIDGIDAAVAATGARDVLLVTDRGLSETPLPARIAGLLADSGRQVSIFAGVRPNPTTSDVDEGARQARTLAPGSGLPAAVVSLGGGSALDAAKAIALAATNSVPADALGWGSTGLAPALPIVAVPTTSGTGAECNDFGVITDSASHRKVYPGGPSCLARKVILDPALTVSLPARPTAAAGFDCLTHAIESYLSSNANPWADALDLQVVRLVQANLRRAVTDGGDLEARAGLMLAAHTAGQAMSTTGLGLVHGLAHPLGGRFDLPHGVALALVAGGALRFNRPSRLPQLAQLASALDVSSPSASDARNADASIAAMEQLAADLGLSGRLSDHAIKADDLPELAADTLIDPVLANTPRPPTEDDLLRILRDSL